MLFLLQIIIRHQESQRGMQGKQRPTLESARFCFDPWLTGLMQLLHPHETQRGAARHRLLLRGSQPAIG